MRHEPSNRPTTGVAEGDPDSLIAADAGPGPTPLDPQPRRSTMLIAAVLALAVVVASAAAIMSTDPLVVAAPTAGDVLAQAREMTRVQEGFEPSPYHPTPDSGVTIGYGYDMAAKTSAEIRRDLVDIEPPIASDFVLRLGAAAGLRGSDADAFVAGSKDIELTIDQAEVLFEKTYSDESLAAADFASNPETYSRFGVLYPAASWGELEPAIQGIVIDLKYRGDYRPWWDEQQALQAAIVANDPAGVLEELSRAEIFPADLIDLAPRRFEARIEWLQSVVEG